MPGLSDIGLVGRLVSEQFPQYSELPISPIEPGGWDNLAFRLGNELLLKLPRDKRYGAQPEREQHALQALAGVSDLQIPNPVGLGKPSETFAHHWSILEWIEGKPVAETSAPVPDLAPALASFLLAIHRPSPSNAPQPGTANFWRGAPLSSLNGEFQAAIAQLPQDFDRERLIAIWTHAMQTDWADRPCWVHGDIAPSNLLQADGQLVAVIDFGLAAAGDPACDLAIAWLAFADEERRAFLHDYGLSNRNLWLRGRAWALWKAILVIAGMPQEVAGYRDARNIVQSILDDRLLGHR